MNAAEFTDIQHNAENIKGFFGDYRWLSNFELSPVDIGDGFIYPSSENAYQAAKVMVDDRKAFIHCTPAKSKQLWKDFTLIDKSAADWDARKDDVMWECLKSKFTSPTLNAKLLATGSKYLEETNWWNDTYWGVCGGKGENKLGKMLMQIRNQIPTSDGMS